MLEIVLTMCFYAGHINDSSYQVRNCKLIHMQFIDTGGPVRPIMPSDCALNAEISAIRWYEAHGDGRIVTKMQCGRVNPKADKKV